METSTIQAIMVPLAEYATINEEATLYEAVKALEESQERLDRTRYHYLHRAILVLNRDNIVVGKLSQLDILMALEPRYLELGDVRALAKAGLKPSFIYSVMEKYSLFDRPLREMCREAAGKKVKELMYSPNTEEYIDVSAPLSEAIHLFVIGQHQSLLVVEDDEIVGILRLTDVFTEAFQIMTSFDKDIT
ncbi:MAG: CBS domain-containing protein [Deltaproteobacteria bacterium]|nr:CBS domain-containing protein [Deltaproteobacteria bacterium]